MPTTAPRPSPPPVRLTTPADVAAAVPTLCGFVPQDSVVLVSLRGRAHRVGLVVRVDLPPPQDERRLARELADRLRADDARAAVVVVLTDAVDLDDGLAGAPLVARLVRSLRRAGVTTVDAVLVRAGRCWSYLCDDPACCPVDGVPLPPEGTPAVAELVARAAYDGRAVLPSRADLEAALAPPDDALLGARLLAADAARRRRERVEGRAVVGADALRAWRRVLARLPGPDPLGPQGAARLVVSLGDVLVRDAVLTLALDDDEALLALLLQLAGRSTAPHDVAVCALLAWTAHARGDGALANVALARALAGDPTCTLAQLCRQALDAGVRPDAVRALLRDARGALQREHPWTRAVTG